ncbi:MAG: phosphoglucosamine mutase [Gemmatimonadales bacterium]
MTKLMRSVSGVRGIVGDTLTEDVVDRHVRAFGSLVTEHHDGPVVLARDSRESGSVFRDVAATALTEMGIDVVDCGLVPTPTAQLAVEHHDAAGGIIITASHNPVEWNALKFVGSDGLFLDAGRVTALFAQADAREFIASPPLGEIRADADAVERHVGGVLALAFVDVQCIQRAKLHVALDCVRGAGGVIMPLLLEALGCRVTGLNLEADGLFPRAPEPTPANLTEFADLVAQSSANIGIAVDPDVDRLAIVDERGRAIGEDYTLAFAVRAVLDRQIGPVVVNLSTSLVVDDVARKFGVEVERVPVGEANVAHALMVSGAAIGGEGNGGVMLPSYHAGRDAPLAAALVLDLLARSGQTVSELVDSNPRYSIVKAKAELGGDLDRAYAALDERFADAQRDTQDGLRLAWSDRWLHVRPSGTEPIIRFIAEAPTTADAEDLISAARSALAETGA